MSFNELNSVEHFIINRLSGINLNNPIKGVQEPTPAYGKVRWVYRNPSELMRSANEVLVESELKQALIRLNPVIAAKTQLADEVIYKLRAVLMAVHSVGLVRANEEFAKWLRGEHTLPFGENHQHIPIHLIDFENLANNSYVVTNQFVVRGQETKIPDVVMLVNGIPLVVGEAKTPVRLAVSWFDGAYEVHNVYENAIPQLFVPNVFSFATEGRDLYYGAVRMPLEFWSPWRLEVEGSVAETAPSHFLGLQGIGEVLDHLLHPRVLLDMLANYTLFSTDKRKRRIKVVCRYQQYEGANLIVQRVIEGRIKKGLIWHFQGSGKSLLMVFAAQKLRRSRELKSPTVLIVVDRTDLDTQITGTFNAADVPNLISTDSISVLHDLLEKDTRKIIITMIQKFREAYPNMNTRDNIVMLVDEAHRTQEGDLGLKMRAALPNAFLFGLTGTPINKADKNTFWAFGAEEDAGGYLSRYTFQDSIRDKATLPLHFEPRLVDVHIDKANLDIAFKELANDLTEDERNKLSKQAAQMSAFLKSKERVATIVADIAKHFREKVAPHGFKAMIVTPDRFACVQYKEELDKHYPPEASAVVISTTANDDYEFKQKWALDKDAQEKLLERFNQKESPLQFLIVTAKLLTGFDAPILQTMYLDKSLKDHTLLQAICRTNRLFPEKTFGRIVDYFGVFDDTAQALKFDEESVKGVVSNLKELPNALPHAVKDCLAHFPNIARTVGGFEGLMQAQECLRTDEARDNFARDYTYLAKIWESLAPDAALRPYEVDYKWLSQVYESVKPPSTDNGRLLWHALGAQTLKLIHEHIHVTGIHDDLEEMVLGADLIEELMHQKDPKVLKKLEKELIKRFRKNAGNPQFIALSERLDALRLKAEKGLISSLDFVKELCELAKNTLQAEKQVSPKQEIKTGEAALTELFIELRKENTPAVVERIVKDIDSIVKIVRFPGWQTTSAGEREVQKSLRKALLKYQLHKDQELFDKAYGYIKEYY
jgi:type I restriction enzyme R subunit